MGDWYSVGCVRVTSKSPAVVHLDPVRLHNDGVVRPGRPPHEGEGAVVGVPGRAGRAPGQEDSQQQHCSQHPHYIYTISIHYQHYIDLCIQYLLDNIYTISTPASLACWSFEIVWKIKPCFHFSKLQYLHCIYTISTLYLCTISSQYLHNIYTYQHYI